MGLSEWMEVAVDLTMGKVGGGAREVREEAELETEEGTVNSKAIAKVLLLFGRFG